MEDDPASDEERREATDFMGRVESWDLSVEVGGKGREGGEGVALSCWETERDKGVPVEDRRW